MMQLSCYKIVSVKFCPTSTFKSLVTCGANPLGVDDLWERGLQSYLNESVRCKWVSWFHSWLREVAWQKSWINNKPLQELAREKEAAQATAERARQEEREKRKDRLDAGFAEVHWFIFWPQTILDMVWQSYELYNHAVIYCCCLCPSTIHMWKTYEWCCTASKTHEDAISEQVLQQEKIILLIRRPKEFSTYIYISMPQREPTAIVGRTCQESSIDLRRSFEEHSYQIPLFDYIWCTQNPFFSYKFASSERVMRIT